MKLRDLLSESVINEIGDLKNVKPYKFSVNGHYTSFTTDKDDRVNVDFTRISSRSLMKVKLPKIVGERGYLYNIGFDISGKDDQFRKSNYKYLIRILKTVVEICKVVIKKETDQARKWNEKLPVFVFGARDKLGRDFVSDSQKMKIYKLILDKNLPSSYRIGKATIDGIPGIFFTENK